MKAAVLTTWFDADKPNIEFQQDYEKPTLPAKKGKEKHVIIKVQACSPAIGDIHMLSGRVKAMGKFADIPIPPCIPGKDVAGIIEQVQEGSKFKVGDNVVASKGMEARGGMSEYFLVNESLVAIRPESIDPLVGAACADSPVTALLAFETASIGKDDRVLVLGGSGGVGSATVQLVKTAGAYVASTSTQADMLKQLGVDRVIDYRVDNWWEVEEFKSNPFTVLIDCVGGNNHFFKSRSVLKSRLKGGRFVAVVGDTPIPNVQTVSQLIGFGLGMMAKPIWTTFAPYYPKYLIIASDSNSETISKVLKLVEAKKLAIVFDPSSPLPFTAEGVASALEIQKSGHAHGKVVVKVI
jgi:NADPH:quinone reductase-like Zn-dependent oxidoreductase